MTSVPQQGVYGFFGPYRFLSNFHFVQVQLDGELYRTTEHAYQAAKTLDLDARRLIQRLSAPRDARIAGQKVQYRDGWEEMKWDVMYDLTCQKFSNEKLMHDLIGTYPMYLEETNTWGDTYWGVCRGVGQNQLGKILMKVREDLISIQQQGILARIPSAEPSDEL
jgi:ribA/ribD-fused uncharacterized protein